MTDTDTLTPDAPTPDAPTPGEQIPLEQTNSPTDHDQLMKKLLRTFFPDFVRIIRPALADQITWDSLSFDLQEMYTDLKDGTKHIADLVARVSLSDTGATRIVTHVEVEGGGSEMGRRMRRYNMQLELREDLPVLPVVLFLKGGKPGIQWNTYRVKILDEVIHEFRFITFGLSRSPAEEYLSRDEPLAWALAALMKPKMGRGRLKLACLKRIVDAHLTDLQKFLLADCVETYIELDEHEAQIYDALVHEKEGKEIATMQMTWSENIRAEGQRLGDVRARRDILHSLLETQFGPLPAGVERKLDAIDSPDELRRLAIAVLSARSLKELGLEG